MNKEYLTYENKILGQEVERLAKEVERLEKVNQMLLNSMVTEAHTKETKEIERLNNIIKEVREYILEKYDYILGDDTFLDHDERIDRKQIKHILDILKGSDKE